MNKIYRLVWNSTHLCWQVVSEIAKGALPQSKLQQKKNPKLL
jgi:hypothetical protein